jgi:hypothetical protein
MKETDISKIDLALKKAFDTITKNYELRYGTYSERQAIFYTAEKQASKEWKRTKTCLYKGCTNKSIRMSHTLQRLGPLVQIAGNGHVFTPDFNLINRRIEMKLMGIGEASTFPGFCEEHENIFRSFEANKSITDERHFRLQTYRTICHEFVERNHQMNTTRKLLYQTWQRLDIKFRELVENELGTDFSSRDGNGITALTLRMKNSIEETMEKDLAKEELYLKELLEEFYVPMSENPESIEFDGNVSIVDFQIPVALAGIGNFWVDRDGQKQSVRVVLNIIPEAYSTTIIVFGRKEFAEEMDAYSRAFCAEVSQILTTIESWMIYGPDHWFIRPSVWNIIEPDKQRLILDSIMDESKSIGSKFGISIFNSVRRKLISLMEERMDGSPNENVLREIVRTEKEKLSDVGYLALTPNNGPNL